MTRLLLFFTISHFFNLLHAQNYSNHERDSLRIAKNEDAPKPDKVLHAEPLYIDLIRDLDARKGEREWNVGYGLTDFDAFDEYELLVEYEFAVIDRMGLEIEVPVFLYNASGNDDKPHNRIESIKTAAQWSFFVNQQYKTSMAIGYINELLFYPLKRVGDQGLFEGNLFNPFLVVAKRWGDRIASYTRGRGLNIILSRATGNLNMKCISIFTIWFRVPEIFWEWSTTSISSESNTAVFSGRRPESISMNIYYSGSSPEFPRIEHRSD